MGTRVAPSHSDDLPWDEPAERLRFAPGESPYSGVRQALARVREGMAGLDKYLGAIERDVDAFEAEWQGARGLHEARRTTTGAPAGPASTTTAGDGRGPHGKSWRDR